MDSTQAKGKFAPTSEREKASADPFASDIGDDQINYQKGNEKQKADDKGFGKLAGYKSGNDDAKFL